MDRLLTLFWWTDFSLLSINLPMPHPNQLHLCHRFLSLSRIFSTDINRPHTPWFSATYLVSNCNVQHNLNSAPYLAMILQQRSRQVLTSLECESFSISPSRSCDFLSWGWRLTPPKTMNNPQGLLFFRRSISLLYWVTYFFSYLLCLHLKWKYSYRAWILMLFLISELPRITFNQ